MKELIKTFNEQDLKELRYTVQVSVVTVSILGAIPLLVIALTILIENQYTLLSFYPALFIILGLIISISYLLNRKKLKDLRDQKKKGETYEVEDIEDIKDFEAGAVGGIFARNKEFTRYNIIVNNTRIRITKELRQELKKGDKVIFWHAKYSNYRLGIEKAPT